MDIDRQKRIAKLKLEQEHIRKRLMLKPMLDNILEEGSFSFLNKQVYDNLAQKIKLWPKDKWNQGLYLQTPISEPAPIQSTINVMINYIEGDHLYFSMMNYKHGLVQIDKSALQNHWMALIDIDKDEIYCYAPDSFEFICIEKTKDIIVGQEQDGKQWIYELTYSSESLKQTLKSN